MHDHIKQHLTLPMQLLQSSSNKPAWSVCQLLQVPLSKLEYTMDTLKWSLQVSEV